MRLDDVNRGIKKFKKRRRIGRGPGSGHGKTAGRGHKGYGSQMHRDAVAQHGPCVCHRRTFAGVREHCETP